MYKRQAFAATPPHKGVGGSGDGGSDGASACPPFSAQGARALATGGELTPELLRVDLTGVCAARSDELASRVRSRTQRSAAPDGADESGRARAWPLSGSGSTCASAASVAAGTAVRRRAHSSGRRSKAEARLYGEDMHSSLSADFLAMFAPSGTVVSTMEGE